MILHRNAPSDQDRAGDAKYDWVKRVRTVRFSLLAVVVVQWRVGKVVILVEGAQTKNAKDSEEEDEVFGYACRKRKVSLGPCEGGFCMKGRDTDR